MFGHKCFLKLGSLERLAASNNYTHIVDDDGAVCVTVSSLSRLFTDEMLNSRNCRVLICQRLTNSDGEVLPRNNKFYINSIAANVTESTSIVLDSSPQSIGSSIGIAVSGRVNYYINNYTAYSNRIDRNAITLEVLDNILASLKYL